MVTPETYYDTTTALPVWNKSFGKLQQAFTYNPAPASRARSLDHAPGDASAEERCSTPSPSTTDRSTQWTL